MGLGSRVRAAYSFVRRSHFVLKSCTAIAFLPFEHGSHMDDEVTPLYHPTVQFTQLDAPACSWYVPLAHAEHKGACSLAKRPGSHCVQFDARDPDDLPATHAVQLMARPLLYVPPEHPSHDVAAISFRVK